MESLEQEKYLKRYKRQVNTTMAENETLIEPKVRQQLLIDDANWRYMWYLVSVRINSANTFATVTNNELPPAGKFFRKFLHDCPGTAGQSFGGISISTVAVQF